VLDVQWNLSSNYPMVCPAYVIERTTVIQRKAPPQNGGVKDGSMAGQVYLRRVMSDFCGRILFTGRSPNRITRLHSQDRESVMAEPRDLS